MSRWVDSGYEFWQRATGLSLIVRGKQIQVVMAFAWRHFEFPSAESSQSGRRFAIGPVNLRAVQKVSVLIHLSIALINHSCNYLIITNFKIAKSTDLFSVADAAVEPGSRSRADEAHATVAEPGEEWVVRRNGDGKTFTMEHFRL